MKIEPDALIFFGSILASWLQFTKFADIIFMAVRVNWDMMGIGTSIACAIHCALLPVVLTSLPIFGINIIHNSFFEWGMIALACLVGTYSLIHGYARHHRSTMPLKIFFTGAIFLIMKQFFPSLEYFFLAIAVLFIISAHMINFRYCKISKACNSPHHKH